MTLRKRTILVTTAIVALSVALTALAYSIFENITNQNGAKDAVTAYSQLAVSAVEMRTYCALDELIYISSNPTIKNYLTDDNIEQQKSDIYSMLLLYAVSNSDLNSIYVTNSSYVVQASTNTLLVGNKNEPIRRQREQLEKGKNVLAGGNSSVFTALSPIMDNQGNYIGCVGGTFSSDIFDDLTSSISGYKEASITIMDATGVVISTGSDYKFERLNDLRDVSNINAQLNLYDKQGRGEPFFYDINGAKHVAYVAHLSPSGWSVLSAVKYTNSTSPFMVAVIVACFAVASLCWYMSKFLFTPLGVLVESIDKLSDDAYGQRMPRIDGQEFSNISGAFNNMLQKIETDHRELLIKEKRHRIVNELSNSIIFEYNIETGLLECSPNGQELDGYPECFDNFPLPFVKSGIVHADDAKLFSRTFTEMVCGRHKSEIELRLRSKDGSYKWYQMLLTTIIDDVTLRPLRVVGKLNNINNEKLSTETLKYQASRDSLTNIYNKGATHALIEERLEVSHDGITDAMLIMDVDNFKRVNDGYGHQRGDEVLKAIASEIATTFRTADIVGRMGGDEFMVFMCDAKSLEIIESRLQSLKSKVNDIMLDEANGDYMSLSIGVALCPKDGTDYNTLYACADAAAYSVKQGGKNNYAFYKDEMNTQ